MGGYRGAGIRPSVRVVLLRGRRRGVLPAGCAGVLVCAGLAVWFPPSAAASAVVGCPIPAGELAGVTVAPALVPASWPSPVPLPAGVTVYGTGEPGGGVYFSAGPPGTECTAQFSSADGGFVTSIAAAGAARPEVESVFSAGGVGPETDLACAYIPAVHQVDIAFRGGDYCPRPPASDSITQVPTGDPALVAATVLTDPGTTDPRLGTSGAAGESTVAVVVAHIAGTSQASGQLADCTLPASQLGVCVAALRVFVAQSVLASSAPVTTRVSSALASIAAPTPAAGRADRGDG